jgi:lysine-specific metallo-endopeptidase family protein
MACAVVCAGTLTAGVAHPPPPVPPLIVVGAGTVFIHGKFAARWSPAPDLAACGVFLGDPKLSATRTVFIGGPSSLAIANQNLQAMLAKKHDDLTRWDAAAQADFEKWFGSADEASRQLMLARIERMQKLLKSYGDSNFHGAGEKNKEGLFAYVYANDDQKVHLGNQWATAPLTGTDSQAGALGHEMSHFKSVGGTTDHIYGSENSKALATTDPAKAIENADNFEYYLEDAP